MSQSKSCIVILEIESSIYFFNNIIGEEKKGKKKHKNFDVHEIFGKTSSCVSQLIKRAGMK